jgi:hypothetical protein
VKIYGVHCNPTNTESKPFYEEVAEMSGGISLSLKHLQLITDMFKAVCYREFGAEVFCFFVFLSFFPFCSLFLFFFSALGNVPSRSSRGRSHG